MTTIDRQPTQDEKQEWDGGDISQRKYSIKEAFEVELASQFQKAMKKVLPFCAQVDRKSVV